MVIDEDTAREFHLACLDGELEKVMEMATNTPELLESSPFADHPLHAAAGKGRLEVVTALLDLGVPVEYTVPETGATALIAAVYLGQIESVKLLLSRGASCSPVQADGRRAAIPLYAAARHGWLDLLELLIQGGGEVNLAWGNTEAGRPIMTALDWAILYNHPAAVDYLRSLGGKTAEELDLVPSPKPKPKKGKK